MHLYAAQILVNALVLGCLYACIAIGFSLVWGVLNVINLIHGSFIVLGAYLAFGLYYSLHLSPWYAVASPRRCSSCSAICLQRLVLNRVIAAPVLVTLTMTFGLDLILNNAMIYFFKADYRKLTLSPPLGSVSIVRRGGAGRSPDRDRVALALTGLLYLLLRRTAGRPRHRRGAAGSRRGDPDGRRRQVDLCHRFRPRRGAGGLRRAC